MITVLAVAEATTSIYATLLLGAVGALGLLHLGFVPNLYPATPGRHREGDSVEVTLMRCLAPGAERAPVRRGRGARAYRRLPASKLAKAEDSMARRAAHLTATYQEMT